jgi:hypothetical protein
MDMTPNTRRLLAAIAITSWSALFPLGNIAPVHADDGLDPHIPNGGALWCQGGMGNVALIPYCDGLHYPDGSFWHQTASSPFGFGGPASLPWNAPELVKP